MPTLAKQTLTLLVVMLACSPSSERDTSDAWLILGRIFSSGLADPAFPLLMAGLVLSIWLYQYVYESRFCRLVSAGPVRIALVVAMLLYMATVVTSGNQEFIYFRF